MARGGGSIRYYVDGDTSGLGRALSDVDRRLSGLGTMSDRVFRGMGVAAATGAAAVGAGFVASIKAASDYEQALANVASVSGANREEMARLSEQALKLGAATKFSAMEAAAGQMELAKAGVSVDEILGGGLQGTLALAAAGDVELGDAAAYAANAMNLFGLAGKDVVMIADAMATAANTTTADVGDFGMALTQGGSAAKLAGLDFHETMVILEALAAAGVKNSDAGTSMKAALLQLINPTAKQAALQRELGVSFIDANGKMKDAQGISEELRRATGHLEEAERAKTFAILAGSDGIRTVNALYEAGPKKLDAYERALQRQGTAAETAARRQQTFQSRVEQLGGAIETIKIRIGQAAIPSLTRLADHLLTDVTPKLDDAAKQIEGIWNRPGLTPEDRFAKSWDAIAATGLPEQAKQAIYQGLVAVGTNGPRFLIQGLQEAPWPAKGVLAALLVAKFAPAFRALGGPLLAGLGGGSAGGRALGTVAGRGAPVPVFVTNPGGLPGGAGVPGMKGPKGATIPGLGTLAAGGGLGLPLAGGAALIAGGIGLNRLDDRFGFTGSSRAENAAKFQARIDAEVAAWRKGGPALLREIQRYSLGDQSSNVAKWKASAEAAVETYSRTVAQRGPKVTRSMDAVVNGAIAPLRGLSPVAARLAADSIVRVTAAMESKGKATRGTTKALIDALESQFGRLPNATRRAVAQAIPPLEAFNRSLSAIRTAAGETASAVESSVDRWAAAARRAPAPSVPSWLTSFSGSGSAAGGLIPGTYRGVDDHLRPMASGEGVLTPLQMDIVGRERVYAAWRATGANTSGTGGLASGGPVRGAAGGASRYVNPFPGGNWAGGPSAHGARALGDWQSDNAWDIMGASGATVYAVLPGTIGRVSASDSRGGFAGQGVYLHTADGQWWYKHIRSLVKPGDKVDAGDPIGTLVSWTNGGPHLHLATPSGDPARARSGRPPGKAGEDDADGERDGKDKVKGSTSQTPTQRVRSLIKKAGLGDSTDTRAMGDRLTAGVPDYSADGASLTDNQSRAISGAGRSARTKARAAGLSPDLVAKAGSDAERAAEVRFLERMKAREEEELGMLGTRKRTLLEDFRALGKRKAKTPQARAAKRRLMDENKAKRRAISKEMDEVRDNIAALVANLRELGEAAEAEAYQERYDQEQADAAARQEQAEAAAGGGEIGPDGQAQIDRANAQAEAARAESAGFGAFVAAVRSSGGIDPRQGTTIINVAGSLVRDAEVASWVVDKVDTQTARSATVIRSPA